ncbi:hypothetical protein AAHC03_013650 [Spirometra sp. Aus1]
MAVPTRHVLRRPGDGVARDVTVPGFQGLRQMDLVNYELEFIANPVTAGRQSWRTSWLSVVDRSDSSLVK